MDAPLFIVGSAGHIDHGKTSLIRALTGVDLDSQPEERRRGITIALGFTRMALPSGRAVAFVDVPGHERLVRTMIAGASGVDAVMLCVSAVEGVMPQTREHLEILKLLGVRHGLIALTMADLVDEEMLELAEEDVREAIEGSFLEGAPLIVTSAETGQGLDALRGAIEALPVRSRGAEGPFRLPVDRAFVARGFGSVVTGTVLSGAVDDGADVELLPSGEKARIRGVQVHGEKVGGSQAGLRTALNLAGVERDDLPRGTVVARPGEVPVTSIIDATYRHLAGAPALEGGARVRLLVATAEVIAVVDPVDAEGLAPGEDRLIQLRTAEPVACLPGDRFVLRRESPVSTLGGGEVLDPWARRAKRRHFPHVAEELTRLAAGEVGVRLERAGPAGLSAAEARQRLGGAADDPTIAATLGDRTLAPAALEALERALRAEMEAWHADHPLAPGANRRELLRGPMAALTAPAFDALLRRLADVGALAIEGPRVRQTSWRVRLSPEQQDAKARLVAALSAAGLDAPRSRELAETVPEGDPLISLMIEQGEALRIGPLLYLTDRLEALTRQVRDHLGAHGELTPGAFKEMTGLTRRGAIPLLEWLDSQGVTRRQGDVRVAARR